MLGMFRSHSGIAGCYHPAVEGDEINQSTIIIQNYSVVGTVWIKACAQVPCNSEFHMFVVGIVMLADALNAIH